MPHFEFTGVSVITQLDGGIDNVALAIQLADPSGWPPGTGAKVVTATIGDAAAGDTEEKVLYSSLTGSTLTVSQRGYDGTPAQQWNGGTKIRHTISAVFASEATDHIHDPTLDAHTQYHNNARHATIAHTLAMMGAGSVGTSQLVDGAVSTPKLGTDAVTQPKMAPDSVGSPEIIPDAVGPSELAAAAVIAGKVAAGGVSATDQLANAIITLAKFAFEESTQFTPDFPNVSSLGTGGEKFGRYWKLGSLVVGMAGFKLGTNGNVTNVTDGKIAYQVPFAAQVRDRFPTATVSGWGSFARALDSSSSNIFSAIGIITDGGRAQDFVQTGVAATWDTLTPFNWDDGDVFQSWFFFETTA